MKNGIFIFLVRHGRTEWNRKEKFTIFTLNDTSRISSLRENLKILDF